MTENPTRQRRSAPSFNLKRVSSILGLLMKWNNVLLFSVCDLNRPRAGLCKEEPGVMVTIYDMYYTEDCYSNEANQSMLI